MRRRILDFLNHSGGYGWFLLGCWVVFGLLLAREARADVYALPGHETASFECRQIAEGVRVLAESRDQGGSIGYWLSVDESAAWRELVVYIWDHPADPAYLFALYYGQCMAWRWANDPA